MWTVFRTEIEVVCIVWAWCRVCLSTMCIVVQALWWVASFCLLVTTSKRARSSTIACSLLCHLPPNHHSTCNHIMFATHCTQFYYMTVYRTRYTKYSVNTFLGLNWNCTVSIFLCSICSVTMLIVNLATIKGARTYCITNNAAPSSMVAMDLHWKQLQRASLPTTLPSLCTATMPKFNCLTHCIRMQ